jgi:hypothetical protein
MVQQEFVMILQPRGLSAVVLATTGCLDTNMCLLGYWQHPRYFVVSTELQSADKNERKSSARNGKSEVKFLGIG